jgi:hypothetical protein
MVRLLPRAWTAACLVCLILTAGMGCATDRPGSTWEDLEATASAFPVPAGFTIIEMERRGELCRRPDCEKPRVILRMAPTEQQTLQELCAKLRQSLDEWEGFGYDELQSADPTGCSTNGQIGEVDVNAFVSIPETTEERDEGTQVIVSVWA